MPQRRPVLANSCAMAATAGEARYRIDRAVTETRSTRVVALDEPVAAEVGRAAGACSGQTRVFTPPAAAASGNGRVAWDLDQVVEGADLVVMVASSDDASGVARALGELCETARVMTAGVIIGHPASTSSVVSALRAHVRMLLVSDTPGDLAGILTALRA